MLGLNEHKLSFELLETGNPKTLVIFDSSYYYEEPERPLLEITLPGYNKYFLVNVEARKVNTFNSNTIGLTDTLDTDEFIDLPDGVYGFKFKICPYNYVYTVQKKMRVTSLLKKLEEVYNKIDLSDCSTKEDRVIQFDLVRIHILIEGAKAVVNKNSKKAFDNYQLANKLVDKLINKFCKNCI